MLHGPVPGVVHTRRAGWKLACRWAAGLMLHSLADLGDVVPMRGHALVLADDLLRIGDPKAGYVGNEVRLSDSQTAEPSWHRRQPYVQSLG